MHRLFKLGVTVFFILILSQLKGTHIIGGYLSYRCMGPNSLNPLEIDYEVTMRLYRDCFNGDPAAREDSVPITVFDENNIRLGRVLIFPISRDTVPDNISNPCVVSQPDLCVEEEIYRGIISLSRSMEHTLTFQRCCRNNQIDNLISPGNQGSTFTVDVPEFDLIGCNSTPVFNNFPPVALCAMFDVGIDLSAIDADGDVLVYSLCSPFNHDNTHPVFPSFSSPPPYDPLPFRSPQTAANPIPSNPSIAIDATTGRLSGKPTTLGRYVMGFCVEEYRNGQLINTIRRDIEITSGNCNPAIINAVQDQQQFCQGLEVSFINQSFSNDLDTLFYLWDFGDAGSANNTSQAKDPIHLYSDTGKYTVTLIVNPGFSCADTSTKEFEVYPLLDPAIEVGGNLCMGNNDVQFIAGGIYGDSAEFLWDFGSTASIASSTNDTVSNVQFSGSASSYPIQLIVDENNCSDTVNTVLNLVGPPTIGFTIDTTAGCFPLPVNFTNLSTAAGAVVYEWDFGDGTTSTLENPSHTYTANGLYSVELNLRTLDNCIDTLSLAVPNVIDVSLDSSRNKVAFTYTPEGGCYPLEVNFINQSVSQGTTQYLWNFGDGTTSTDPNPTHTYLQNGYYDVQLTLSATERCVETIATTVDSAIHISLDSSKNVIDFDFSPKEGCPGTTVQFFEQTFTEGGANFIWDFGDNTQSFSRQASKTYNDTGTYSVGLILISSTKCVDTLIKVLADTIRIHPFPTAALSLNDTNSKVLKEARFLFDGSASTGAQQSHYLINGVSVGNTDILDYQFQDTGTYTVEHIVRNSYGCEDTSRMTVFVYDEFEFLIPNVFTPNGDGVNETFKVRACGVYEYEVEIYNRYGEVVFYSNSMNQNWDGRIAGKKASSGVYFYLIRIKDFRGQYLDYKGTVTLLEE